MLRQFNLIKNDAALREKRVLPSFPFCFMVFRPVQKSGNNHTHVYEVKDISHGGMQLALKDGIHNYKSQEFLSGELHWHGKSLNVEGEVKWVTKSRMGIEFSKSLQKKILDFLSLKNFVSVLRPLHDTHFDVDTPSNLKYWLRADGPFEVFIWQHGDGEFSKLQVIVMENFIEWSDGSGVKTGRVVSKRDVDTPLITEDEFLFAIDDTIDLQKVTLANDVLTLIPESNLSANVRDFFIRQLK